uniref:Secreted protein n=1 Tax=Setaria viridis TaxID=4556 RepID=A0A4U6W8E7_SETVI|nr:hypothetical protein SEVIR_1G124550v2 [Setaria viridis]
MKPLLKIAVGFLWGHLYCLRVLSKYSNDACIPCLKKTWGFSRIAFILIRGQLQRDSVCSTRLATYNLFNLKWLDIQFGLAAASNVFDTKITLCKDYEEIGMRKMIKCIHPRYYIRLSRATYCSTRAQDKGSCISVHNNLFERRQNINGVQAHLHADVPPRANEQRTKTVTVTLLLQFHGGLCRLCRCQW